MVKAGQPEVFPLLGYSKQPKIKLNRLKITNKLIKLGEALEFQITMTSEARESQRVVVDYAVYHVKANNSLAPKVFKLKSIEIVPGGCIQLTKRHAVKKISTRKYYPGGMRLKS